MSGEGSGFVITFTGTVPSSEGNQLSLESLMETEAKFYRIVKVIGLYDKKEGDANTISSNPIDNSPKELRFCVKVFYVGVEYGFSELCSLMTNFKA
jgi:hypothetical protein